MQIRSLKSIKVMLSILLIFSKLSFTRKWVLSAFWKPKWTKTTTICKIGQTYRCKPSTCFVASASGKGIGQLGNELVLGTPEVVYWHDDSDHDGTSSEKAYVITTADGLDYLASCVKSGNRYYSMYFKLGADIAYDPDELTFDLDGDGTNESNFPGIGGSYSSWIYSSFGGTFDGDGHTISGLHIDKTNCGSGNIYVGLFGFNVGIVKNVTVSNSDIRGGSDVGGIVGDNNGTIENCLANGVSITATSNRGGAIVGENTCYNGAYSTILSRNYYTGCTLTIGSNSPATTNIGCGHKADGTNTPTDITEVTVNNVTYYDGAISALVLADKADNTSVISSHNGETVNVVLYGRTLYKDGKWNTLCLPFNLTISGSVLDGDNVEVRTLSSTSFNSTTGTLTLNFTAKGAVTELQAGTPYIIKWSKNNPSDPALTNLVDPVFTCVTISNTTANVSTDYVDFMGTYEPINFTEDNKSILLVGVVKDDQGQDVSTLYWPKNGAHIYAFRGYFQLKNGLTVGDIQNARMFLGDDDATGIETMYDVRSKMSDVWYTIDGRKLQGTPTKPGLYIYNGRKVKK